MKSGHFVIYIGMCSPFQASSKPHPWLGAAFVFVVFDFFFTLGPSMYPSSPCHISAKGACTVTFLFDMRKMDKAISNICRRDF